MPGGLNLLLLLPVLDRLGIDQLLQLLLLGDQQMVLVGSSLGGHLLRPILIKRSKRNESDSEKVNGHRVVTRSNILSINGCDWEGRRALCNLRFQWIIFTRLGVEGFLKNSYYNILHFLKARKLVISNKILVFLPGLAASTESAQGWC